MTNLCDVCGKPATQSMLRDPFGKSDEMRFVCSDHGFRIRDPADVAAIEQLHAAVKTAQELAATRLMEIQRLRFAHERIKQRYFESVATMATGELVNELARISADALGNSHEPFEQRPADGTRDGDGVWQGGFWHPDTPDPLDEWRLMEFAPKDGTRILALVTEVQFYRGTETPNELIPVVVKWTGEYSGWSMPGHGGLQPTLWLPIKLTNDPQGASRDASSEKSGE